MNKYTAGFFFLMAILLLASCGPISRFTYDVKGGHAPADVVFDNESAKAESYMWDFGDGDTSSLESPKHRYSESGNYTVTLKAIKGNKTKTFQKNVYIASPEKCLVELSTDYGNMVIELYDATPQHRDNFIKLIEEGYYDGLLFHRVIEGFMIQGGDPNSRNAPSNKPLGSGGPGYLVPAELVDSLVHIKGALAAARTDNPEKASSGSQFYIVHGQKIAPAMLDKIASQRSSRYSSQQKNDYRNIGGTPQLDGAYTVFGRVIEGLEVIDKIAKVATDGRDRPKKDVQMTIKVVR